MPDKYDEVAEQVDRLIERYDCDVVSPAGGKLDIATYLRSAFPPPAEDARQCATRIKSCIKETIRGPTGGAFYVYDYDEERAAAEISRFAESRVEPWREALRRALADFERSDWGTELPSESEAWVYKARALLSDSPAKEADNVR